LEKSLKKEGWETGGQSDRLPAHLEIQIQERKEGYAEKGRNI
jgi:hypothetical protein